MWERNYLAFTCEEMKAWRGQPLAQGHPAGKWQVLHLHPGVVVLVPVSYGMRGVSSCVKELGMLEGWENALWLEQRLLGGAPLGPLRKGCSPREVIVKPHG